MTTQPGPLDYERHALRWTLTRLMGPNQDLEMLCKFVPRLANSAAAITRIQPAAGSQNPPAEFEDIRNAIRNLLEERITNEEEN